MNTARIVVLTIAPSAGGVAAYLASGSDGKPPPTEPVAQLQTAAYLVAKAEIVVSEIIRGNIRALGQAPIERDGQNSVVGKTATFELKPEQTSILAAARLVRYGVSTPTILN